MSYKADVSSVSPSSEQMVIHRLVVVDNALTYKELVLKHGTLTERNKYQTIMLRNSAGWWEKEDKLVIYQHAQGPELGSTEKQPEPVTSTF